MCVWQCTVHSVWLARMPREWRRACTFNSNQRQVLVYTHLHNRHAIKYTAARSLTLSLSLVTMIMMWNWARAAFIALPGTSWSLHWMNNRLAFGDGTSLRSSGLMSQMAAACVWRLCATDYLFAAMKTSRIVSRATHSSGAICTCASSHVRALSHCTLQLLQSKIDNLEKSVSLP